MLVIAASLLPVFLRESNREALAKKGRAAWEAGKPDVAAGQYSAAGKIEASPELRFNEATARVAAGDYALGSSILSDLTSDPKLKPSAHYNRGNSAFGADALDGAIADYQETLRLQPGSADAKRNLELALRRRQQQQSTQTPQEQSQTAGGKGNEGQQSPQPSPDSQGGKGETPVQQSQIEALLRAVEQQEREELSRMRRQGQERKRVGW
jgi:Ca-activated chloride channel family protein